MSIGAIGSVFILVGLGTLLTAVINATSDAVPPRTQRLEVIQRKQLAGEPLSSNEKLEAQQAKFERKLPLAGFVCLLVGSVLIFIA